MLALLCRVALTTQTMFCSAPMPLSDAQHMFQNRTPLGNEAMTEASIVPGFDGPFVVTDSDPRFKNLTWLDKTVTASR